MRQNSTSLPLQTYNIDQTPQQMEIAYNQQRPIQHITYKQQSQQALANIQRGNRIRIWLGKQLFLCMC